MIFPSTSRSARQVLEQILFIFQVRKQRSQAIYAVCGRSYLSSKTGFCLKTITRATDELVQAGLLEKEQRRKVRGTWQTCLYKPTPYLFSLLKRFIYHWKGYERKKSPTVLKKSVTGFQKLSRVKDYLQKSSFWNRSGAKKREKLRC